MNLDERKARLLRAVVHEFIHTAEPVGSRSLTERYSLGVSAATIRNELAALEEQGYLSHPHTSAGRVPTDRGYRFYVDALSGVGELARAQAETIARFFEGTADLEETLQRTSVLLSSLTHYTAMVSPPGLDRSRLRHIELVGLGRRDRSGGRRPDHRTGVARRPGQPRRPRRLRRHRDRPPRLRGAGAAGAGAPPAPGRPRQGQGLGGDRLGELGGGHGGLLAGHLRLPRRRRQRQHRRARPDPDGLPSDHGRRPGGGAVPWRRLRGERVSDYYQLLGVDRGAGSEEIKRAYRRLARQFHPDVNGNDPQAAERFKEISKAYSVLSDPEKRQRYDAYGEDGIDGFTGPGGDPFAGFGASFDDLLGAFFGGGDPFVGRPRTRSRARRGESIGMRLRLPFTEAVFGTSKDVRVRAATTCSRCHGSGAKPGTEPTVCSRCNGSGQG